MRFVFLVFVLLIAAQPTPGWAVDFSFKEHWKVPIPPQGPPPENFSDLESSLDPEDCGSCHESQYEDWLTSRHSIAMGPGISGQLHSPWVSDPFVCTNCHAPLAEQSPQKESKFGGFEKNSGYIPTLRSKGLVCAACHVRKHIHYGPKSVTEKEKEAPHNSFVEVENFGNSEFCKPCHQFEPNGNRVSGKLIQNTYEEWKNSSYAKKGVQCTGCHMPDRKHLWQGIHYPEMVKKGITIKAERKGPNVILKIINSGVGHNFPTYVTPKIVIRGSVIDKEGKEIPKTAEEKFIGWNIPINLSNEFYDTRIAPGKAFDATFNIKPSTEGKKFRLIIRVYPDDFYTRFFEALINYPPDGIDVKKMKEAYDDSTKSSYTLFEKSWDLKSINN